MIPNPYMIVGAILLLVLSFYTGYNNGFRNGKNETEAHYSVVKDEAAAEFKKQLDKYKEEVVQSEIVAKQISEKNAVYTSKLEKDLRGLRNVKPTIYNTSTNTCGLTDDFRLRVNNTVSTINEYAITYKAGSPIVSNKLPTVTATER